jgi:tripartite-type tricarboxylate transporter receptor subunit TctC
LFRTAPAGTPKTVITQLNAAENAELNRPEVRAAFAKLDSEMRVLSTKEYAGALRERCGYGKRSSTRPLCTWSENVDRVRTAIAIKKLTL